jgi:septation ring formation regulator EzrA
MDIMTTIAEDKIKAAIQSGEMDDIAGMGKPLELKDDLPGMSPELKMGYRLLKNAGFVNEELELKKEMLSLEDLMACCQDDAEKIRLEKKLTKKRMRFNEMMKKKRTHTNSRFGSYAEKIYKLFE